MPAYVKTIPTHTCGWDGCYLSATHELYNGRNALVNRYCERHAGIALDSFRASHDEPDYPNQ